MSRATQTWAVVGGGASAVAAVLLGAWACTAVERSAGLAWAWVTCVAATAVGAAAVILAVNGIYDVRERRARRGRGPARG